MTRNNHIYDKNSVSGTDKVSGTLFSRLIELGLPGDGENESPDRTAARAVIPDSAGRLLMVRTDRGDFKFPGGGVEKGESIEQALIREVREEVGLTLSPGGIIRPLFRVVQRRQDMADSSRLFVMRSDYYLCAQVPEGTELARQELDDYEVEQGFSAVFVELRDALAANEVLLLGGGDGINKWVYRDTVVLRELAEPQY